MAEIGAKSVSFDVPQATAGFIGIAVEGTGFVSIRDPKVTALK